MVKEYSKLSVSHYEKPTLTWNMSGVDGKMDGAKFKENFVEAMLKMPRLKTR